jgi:hypothetical protein
MCGNRGNHSDLPEKAFFKASGDDGTNLALLIVFKLDSWLVFTDKFTTAKTLDRFHLNSIFEAFSRGKAPADLRTIEDFGGQPLEPEPMERKYDLAHHVSRSGWTRSSSHAYKSTTLQQLPFLGSSLLIGICPES